MCGAHAALETSRRCAELDRELGIPRVVGVANKVRDAADARAIREYAGVHGIPLGATIPFDDRVRLADLAGTPLLDVEAGPAVREIGRLAASLVSPAVDSRTTNE